MDFLTAKHVFIDTNVLLSFYHYSGDDLEELKKLVVLLEQKKVKLYLPSQVLIEFSQLGSFFREFQTKQICIS